MGCSKYLGIIVGPQADADINFLGPMRKFWERAVYWLACPEPLIGVFPEDASNFAISVMTILPITVCCSLSRYIWLESERAAVTSCLNSVRFREPRYQ